VSNFHFFNADDRTFAFTAVVIHTFSFLFLMGVLGSIRPAFVVRAPRLKLFLTVQPLAAVLGGLIQVYAVTQIPKLNPPYVFANHHRLIFFALPYVLHVVAFVVGLWRAARHPSSALKDDFSDTDLLRHRDVTPPRARRPPQPGSDLLDPPGMGM
jgi:hypothetical protein